MNIYKKYYNKNSRYYIPTSNNRIGNIMSTTTITTNDSSNGSNVTDSTYSRHGRISRLLNIGNSLNDCDLYYLVYNTDSINNDTTIYSNPYGSNGTITDAIKNRLISDSGFRNTINTISSILKAPTINTHYNSIQMSIDIYYRNISRIHTDIANVISRTLPTDSRKFITIPIGYSIPISLIISDIYKHINISNSYLNKTITNINKYTNGSLRNCPTISVNNIKRGSDVISLLNDSRIKKLNSKSIKDIIPTDMILDTDKYIPTISAMRIDSGIAPTVIWTGNSRDYLIISIVDYDTTNYYVVYSTLLYTDREIYDSIYNDYNGIYSSYRQYAMDSSFSKYLSIFNDPKYIKWSFNVQKGNMSNCPINISKYDIHKTYLYNKKYYYYSTYKDNLWEKWDNIILEHGSINEYIPTLTLSRFIDSVVSSINYYTDDGNSNIIRRAIDILNSYITIFTIDGKDTTNLEEGKVVLIEEYSKSLNKDSGYLYKKDCFDPYTEKMHKGTSGSITYGDYTPTYVSGRLTMVTALLYPSGYKGQRGKVGDNMPKTPTMKSRGIPTLPKGKITPLKDKRSKKDKVGFNSMYSSKYNRVDKNYKKEVSDCEIPWNEIISSSHIVDTKKYYYEIYIYNES